MVTRELIAEILIYEDAALAESPIWDHRCNKLVWADISKNIIWCTDVSTGTSEKQVLNQPVGCVAPYKEKGYVIASGNGFYEIDELGQKPVLIISAFEEDNLKFNDGKIDQQGRFWAGSACLNGARGLGHLYCLDENRSSNAIFGGITASNGFDWSPDGLLFYYVDTAAGGIDVFDVVPETGEFQNRRRFVDIPTDIGLADGLTVDAEGGVWLAIWYSGAVFRYSPSGKLIEIVSVPVCRTSSCVFGGDNMQTLFITTAKGKEISPYPTEVDAGAIFAIETNTQGQRRSSYVG